MLELFYQDNLFPSAKRGEKKIIKNSRLVLTTRVLSAPLLNNLLTLNTTESIIILFQGSFNFSALWIQDASIVKQMFYLTEYPDKKVS